MLNVTAVLLLMINGNYTVDVTPIYFQSMMACEAAAPAIVKQVRSTRPVIVTWRCYEEAGQGEANARG